MALPLPGCCRSYLELQIPGLAWPADVSLCQRCCLSIPDASEFRFARSDVVGLVLGQNLYDFGLQRAARHFYGAIRVDVDVDFAADAEFR